MLDVVPGGPEVDALCASVVSCRMALHDAASVRAKSIVAYSVRERVVSPTGESPKGGARSSSAYTISLSLRIKTGDGAASATEVAADDTTEETEMEVGRPGFGVGLGLVHAVLAVLRRPLEEAASLALLLFESRRDLGMCEDRGRKGVEKDTNRLVESVRLG